MSSSLPPLPPHLDPRGRRRTGGSGRRVEALHLAALGTKVISALLSATLLVGFGVFWWKYRTFTGNINRLSVFGTSTNRTADLDGKDQNILVVGNDDRSSATDAELSQLGTTRDGGSLNTDTMMIIHVPANGEKATLLSLPRDSYVPIPGYGTGKLNSAYPQAYNAAGGSLDAKRAAGAKELVRTIQDLTGLSIDHFVQVDLLGFYRISNAVGGIPVTMCNAVRESNSGINLKKGLNVIKGTQALAFVRQRYGFADGDLSRVKRQQYFLTAAFRKVASAGTLLNPFKLQRLLDAVTSSLYLDATLDPIQLARQLENLTADNITGRTIPTDGFGTSNDGQSILVVNPAEVKAFVNRIIGTGDTALEKAKPLDPAEVTVDVYNAGSYDGAAAENGDVLRNDGFQVGTVASSDTPSSATMIQYSDGQQAQAKTLAAYVPGAALQKIDGLDHVRLQLGSDGLKAIVKAPASSGSSSAPASSAPATTAAAATSAAKPSPTATPKPIDAGCIN